MNLNLRTFAVAASLLACGLTQAIAADESQSAAGRTLLLVDDHHVLYRSGTRRLLHKAERRALEPIIAETKPWELAIGWTSIYRHPATGKYQLWYQAYAGKRTSDKKLECVVCYAESDDGLTFTKPELDLFPFENEAKTNIVLIGSGLYGDRYCNSVLVDEREKDPLRRYKMAYYDWSLRDGRIEAGMHAAFSPDGIRWTKHPQGPLYQTRYGGRGIQPVFADEDPFVETPVTGKPPRKEWRYQHTMSDAVDVFYDPRREVFAIYGKTWLDSPLGGGAWKHGIARTQSKDFVTWSKAEFILGPDDRDAPDAEFHTAPVFFHNGCYFSLNQILNRRGGGSIDIELMTSRDGDKWDRLYREEFFMSRSGSDLYDGRAIFTNSTPVILDDEIRFYYGAYNQTPIGGVQDNSGRRSGVGMASIPRDRFGGIRPLAKSDQTTLRRPVENIGQVTLRPLDMAGCRELTVNADAAQGSFRVELLTDSGYRVRGYTQDDCPPLAGDSLRHAVKWNERSLADLPPGKYLLRLHLNNAAVYALTLR